MWWYGRGNSGGAWLPEKKKANMSHGRENSGGSWPPAFPRSSNQQDWLYAKFPGSWLAVRFKQATLLIGWILDTNQNKDYTCLQINKKRRRSSIDLNIQNSKVFSSVYISGIQPGDGRIVSGWDRYRVQDWLFISPYLWSFSILQVPNR